MCVWVCAYACLLSGVEVCAKIPPRLIFLLPQTSDQLLKEWIYLQGKIVVNLGCWHGHHLLGSSFIQLEGRDWVKVVDGVCDFKTRSRRPGLIKLVLILWFNFNIRGKFLKYVWEPVLIQRKLIDRLENILPQIYLEFCCKIEGRIVWTCVGMSA